MSQRTDFIADAGRGGLAFSVLCRKYGISRKTGYKYLARDDASEWSRGARRSPRKTAPTVEALVCELRSREPVWGGRKITHRLLLDAIADLPAASTITDILSRHGLLSSPVRPQRDLMRFDAEQPGDLWSMDFKGPLQTTKRRLLQPSPCWTSTLAFCCLGACPDQQTETVQAG